LPKLNVFFIGVTLIYISKTVYLSNAILAMKIFCYRYSTINNFAKNNILQRNLVIVLAIYCGLRPQNFIQIRLDLTFLLYDV